jgi:hypothetical protein
LALATAPFPGNGAVVLPPASILDAENDPTALFPVNQTGAEDTYGGTSQSAALLRDTTQGANDERGQ